MSNFTYQLYHKTLTASGVLFTLNIVKIMGKSKLLKELIIMPELAQDQIKLLWIRINFSSGLSEKFILQHQADGMKHGQV
jgi:hypothetical protein